MNCPWATRSRRARIDQGSATLAGCQRRFSRVRVRARSVVVCLVAPGQEISCLGARAVIVHDPSNTRLLMTVKNRDFLKKDSDVGDAYVKLATLVDASGAALPKKANEELKLIDPRTGQQCGGGSIIRVGLELVSAHEARGELTEAAASFRAALKLDPQDHPARVAWHVFNQNQAKTSGGAPGTPAAAAKKKKQARGKKAKKKKKTVSIEL